MALGSSKSFATLMNAGRPAPLKPWTPPEVPAAIARPAPAPVQTQWAKPAVTSMPRIAPAPANWGGGGGGGAITQPGTMAASAPAPTSQKSEAELAAMAEVDSTFTDQKSMYANALKKYIEDYTQQKGNLERDAGTAQTGIERNRTVGLTGLSEDFASRGLANSGMFADNLDRADDQYDKQKENITTGLTNSVGDLNFRKAKYEAENGENGTNIQAARREAYARLAAAQNLT